MEDDDGACVICLEPLIAKLVVQNCGHVFHAACARRCEQLACPLCRTSLKAAGATRQILPHTVALRTASSADVAAEGAQTLYLRTEVDIEIARARQEELRLGLGDLKRDKEKAVKQARELEGLVLRTCREVRALQNQPVVPLAPSLLAVAVKSDGAKPMASDALSASLALRCRELLKGKVDTANERRRVDLDRRDEERLRASVVELKVKVENAKLRLREEDADSGSRA
ncbi:hypothetical protein T492DRAFT_958154 [Pavlovales sp. CCMP2436]|nr:hypothetical protein T492DRAFT_958154 [Pavlovales sp. CCMP2436]